MLTASGRRKKLRRVEPTLHFDWRLVSVQRRGPLVYSLEASERKRKGMFLIRFMPHVVQQPPFSPIDFREDGVAFNLCVYYGEIETMRVR